MAISMSVDTAAGKLRRAFSDMEKDPPPAVDEQDEVLNEFQPIFQLEDIDELPEEQFLRFLPYKNNRHWTGLHRKGPKMTEDMDQLRVGLKTLLNEQRDLPSRITDAKDMVSGMGKGTLTAILLVAYPEKYGVWNNTSETALKQLDVWPDFDRGEIFGSKYQKVNSTLTRLSDEVGIDLWTLDSLLDHFVENAEDEPLDSEEESKGGTGEFVAEKHLQKYLVDNWDAIELSQEWDIYSDTDDPEAGVEYPTDVGPADILLNHKTEQRICVVELKKSRSSDRAVGQLLRYIGWVQSHLEELDEVASDANVEGLLITGEETDRLQYALSVVPQAELQLYNINFKLTDASESRI
jgi:hypothetical protein